MQQKNALGTYASGPPYAREPLWRVRDRRARRLSRGSTLRLPGGHRMNCQVGWIDCHNTETFHAHPTPAIGYAVFTGPVDMEHPWPTPSSRLCRTLRTR